MTKIIQISDTHIVQNGRLAYDRVDTAAALFEAVATINRHLPSIGPVELAIVTGDLTDFGEAEEYARFLDIMSGLNIPFQAVPGNHDDRETMRKAFRDQQWMPEQGPINWRYDLKDFSVLALDSNVQNCAHGTLETQTLSWLGEQLKKLGTKPALIALHHPPIKTGLDPMDRQNLRNSAELQSVIDTHKGPVRITCGHVHRNVSVMFGRALCQIAPGTSHAVTMDQRATSPNSLTIEPGGVLLHEFRENIQTHMIPVGRFVGPYPFTYQS